jgi:hypothetical protein
MATGSNDKTVKLMRFNSDTSNLEGNLFLSSSVELQVGWGPDEDFVAAFEA